MPTTHDHDRTTAAPTTLYLAKTEEDQPEQTAPRGTFEDGSWVRSQHASWSGRTGTRPTPRRSLTTPKSVGGRFRQRELDVGGFIEGRE